MRGGPTGDAIDLIEWIVGNCSDIERMEFVHCPAAPAMLVRAKLAPREYVLSTSNKPGFKLWFPPAEALMSEAVRSGTDMENVLEQAVWHDESKEGFLRESLHRDEINREKIAAVCARAADQMFTVSSQVCLTDAKTGYLPMMDFQCPVEPEYQAAILMALKMAGAERGALLVSGNSYHYYGFEPLTYDAWRKFLGKCLLLTPLTDIRYMGHRLIANEFLLRLAPHGVKNATPKIVAITEE